MIYTPKEAVIMDIDYTLIIPSLERILRIRATLRRIPPPLKGRLIQLVHPRLGYVLEDMLLRSRVSFGRPLSLVSPENLSELSDYFKIGLITRRYRTQAEEELAQVGHNLQKIDVFLGREDAGFRAMNGEHIGMCLEKLNVASEATTLLSDSPKHILTGNRLGFKTIAVTTGWYSAKEFEKYRPSQIFSSPDLAISALIDECRQATQSYV